MLHEQAPAYGSSDWRCRKWTTHQSLQVSSVESTPSVYAREILARFFSYAWRLRRCVQSETRRIYAKYHEHTSPPTGRENFLSMQSVLGEIVISAAKEVVQIVEV